MLTGLNHITIAVLDLEQSLAFYVEKLGFKGHVKWNNGAYLSIGDTWFCLSCDKANPKNDYTHIAFDIAESDFTCFCARLKEQGVQEWKTNTSEGKSLYILDPNGHKLEIHSGSLTSRLESLRRNPYDGQVWL